MAPTLLIGPVALPTYPISLLLALWLGMAVAARRASRLGLDGDHIYNAGLYGLIAGIVGARGWFVLSHWENYAGNLSQALSLSRSALSVAEGLLVAGLVVLIYVQVNKVPLGLFLDALTPGLAVATIIANIGAFLGGEALGAPSSGPWAVELANIARHPVQIYEAVVGGGILVILFIIRHFRPWSGFQFWTWVILYSTGRLILEIFRDRPALVGAGFLAVQIIALSVVVVSLAVMAYNFCGNPVRTEAEKHEFIR